MQNILFIFQEFIAPEDRDDVNLLHLLNDIKRVDGDVLDSSSPNGTHRSGDLGLSLDAIPLIDIVSEESQDVCSDSRHGMVHVRQNISHNDESIWANVGHCESTDKHIEG